MWRKKTKRGVSPIIATILLVAITVVLAAVLYVLISGLTRGPGNTPIGSAFGMANPTTETGSTGWTVAANGCLAGDTCYTVQIASASSGLNWNNIQFVLHTTSGSPVALSGGSITILGASGTSASAGCAFGTTCTAATAVSTSQVIVIDTGIASSSTNTVSGDILVANGQGSYSSSTSITLP